MWHNVTCLVWLGMGVKQESCSLGGLLKAGGELAKGSPKFKGSPTPKSIKKKCLVWRANVQPFHWQNDVHVTASPLRP